MGETSELKAYAPGAKAMRIGPAPHIAIDYAGAGPLVVFLHGIGGDRAAWTPQIEAFSGHYTTVAWDARGYGDSDDYEGPLRFADMADDLVRVLDAFAVRQAHIVGTSMGGRIALQLAALHPEHFSGFIAIEASDFQPAWYDIDWFHRPDAHGGEMGAALVSANISPHAPEAERWNTLWMFMQSGPGVFRGDLSFYTRDDSLIGRLAGIDTGRTPVHIIVGAYDLTCTPADAARTARAIPGATLAVMDELGHFPMSEHPEGFRPFFVDALARMPRVRAEVA